MDLVTVTNANQFSDQIMGWVDDVRQEVADVANGITVEIFYALIQNSAQYSGDYAANWNYSIGVPDVTFVEGVVPAQPSGPYVAGDRPAITWAIAHNKWRDQGYLLGQTFYLTNAAVHDGDAYAWKIEDSRIKFRPGNAGATVARSLSPIVGSYLEISQLQAQRLSRKKL